LVARIDAERAGTPFLVFRDERGAQQIIRLPQAGSRLTIGRSAESDVRLEWDDNVSRVHAELIRVGGEWTVTDDGLSRNGSYVNGERIAGRRRLRDGDSLRLGETAITYRAPASADRSSTTQASGLPTTKSLSPSRRRVLIALARPVRSGTGLATPATNQQIADELSLSVPAVKTHLRALFEQFGVKDLPQNQKRSRLLELALLAGVVTERDLADEQG